MAMLAEPRRRQKLSFDPRNKAWSEDSTKYGQKLMEKMGWSKGKGLGVNEDGDVEHIKVSLKNNNLGVGCKASQEDNWIAHQDDFNDLLSSLNEGYTPSTSNEKDAVSLEERSKKSRSRVHYKKFTRGKDLTRYGEEGMNSILGRRLTSSAPVTPQTQSAENSDDDDDDDDDGSKEKKELTHGVVTIKSSCSIGEYFAQKMSALKRGKKRQVSESHSDTELEAPRCGFGFSESQGQGRRSDEDVAGPSGLMDGGNEGEEEEQEVESEEGPEGPRNHSKKKKKRKKKKARAAARDSDEDDEQIEVRGESDIEEDEGIDLGRKKKKNKKKKRLVDESKSESASEHNENGERKKKKKTKKSKKDKNRDTPCCSQDDDTAETSEERSSGETSKRKRDSSEEGLEEDRAETSSGKKKRKKPHHDGDMDNYEGPSTSTKKKKKKKQKI